MAWPQLTDPTTGQSPPADQLWIQQHRINGIAETASTPGGGAALEDPGGPGLVVRTALEGVTTNRSLTQPSAGLTISNSDGVSGNPTFALANDLAALEGLSGVGVAQRTGTDAWSIARITDNGADIDIGGSSAATITIGSVVVGSNTSIGGADASGFSADTDVTIIGDYNGVGNASWVYVKDSIQEIELRGLLLVPYAAGVMDVGEVAAPFKSVIIGNAANNSSKLTGTFTANRTLTLPDSSGTLATQAYADALVVGLLDDRGNYDASVNLFPSSGGSGSAGAILKGDLWTISVAGTLGGHAVTAGDVVRALVDTPGQTDANWAISENNFGYVPLSQALADGKIYIGNGSGIGTAVTPSGDVTISNTGVTAIGNLKVTNAMIANATIDLTAKVTGILPSANGGTGINNAGRTLTISTNSGTLAFGAASKTLTINNSIALSGTDSTVMTFPTTNATIARTDAGQTFTGNQTFAGHLFPSVTDTYDLGSSLLLWRKGWLSELDAVLFAQNTISVIGGWLMIAKNEGLIPVGQSVGTGDTTIDFGQAMTANDFVIFRAAGAVEYVQVLTLSSGTRYNVTRNLDGSGANAWPAGSVYVVLGNTTSGRIELNANSTPRISMIVQGATYNAQTEMLRAGDLNGNWGFVAETYGFASGQYGTSGKSWFSVDPTNGVRLGSNTTTRINLAADGSGFLANSSISWDTSGNLTVSANANIGGFSIGADYIRDAANSFGLASTVTGGDDVRFWAGDTFANRATAPFRVTEAGVVTANSGLIGGWTVNSTAIQNSGATVILRGAGNLAFGSTPPTSATVGTGLFLDSTGMYGLASNVQQAIFNATTGAITAGAGDVILDANGVTLNTSTSPLTTSTLLFRAIAASKNVARINASLKTSGGREAALFVESTSPDTTGSANARLGAVAQDGTTAALVVTKANGVAGIAAFTCDVSTTGVITAGSGPTTLTDSAGKILSAALNTVAVANGGTGTTTAFTAGSVVFAGASGVYSQDNGGLFYDDANNRLGINTTSPLGTLDIRPTAGGATACLLFNYNVNNHTYVRAGGASADLHLGDTLTRDVLICEGGGVVKAGTTPITLTDGAGKILSAALNTVAVANGGTGDTGTAWTSHTPTITAGSGTFTTVSGTFYYKIIGKTCFLWGFITVTTVGSAAGYIKATLPAAVTIKSPSSHAQSGGARNENTSKTCTLGITNEPAIYLHYYDGTFPAVSGDTIDFNTVIELA